MSLQSTVYQRIRRALVDCQLERPLDAAGSDANASTDRQLSRRLRVSGDERRDGEEQGDRAAERHEES